MPSSKYGRRHFPTDFSVQSSRRATSALECPSGQQHDLRAQHLPVGPGVLPRAAKKLTLLRLTQLDPVLAGHYQQDSPPFL